MKTVISEITTREKHIKNRKRIIIVFLIISALVNFIFIPLFIIRMHKDKNKIEILNEHHNKMVRTLIDIKINTEDAKTEYENTVKKIFLTNDTLEIISAKSSIPTQYVIFMHETESFIDELNPDSLKKEMSAYYQ